MTQELRVKLLMELVWWVLTAIVVYLVISPLKGVFIDIPFLSGNIIGIVAAITYARHILFLKHSLIARALWFKVVLVFVSIPMVFWLVSQINSMQIKMDEDGLFWFETFIRRDITAEQRLNLFEYFKHEYIFFCTSAVMGAIIFPFRLIISIWRQYNVGTV